ncbi:hypothetical protein A0U92_12970 [Acetobacter aceti]|uniref:N-acetyltransferase domain-containing protein n=1 Tax=Acetobacter aceti TaxID=435 RepID=A0A1U9KL15_ACEAC|nr:hypothetical protein A0U92_12970 [Acetobacter aceti]
MVKPTLSFSIRKARHADAALLPDIERSAAQAFRNIPSLAWIADDEPISEKRHEACIAAETCWVAVDETGNPVAFLSTRREGVRMHIMEMSVVECMQGNGIGAALLETLAVWAEKNHLTAITLTTFCDVPWNAPFYARKGFVVLAGNELDNGLKAILEEESRHGFLHGSRCAMQRLVGRKRA